MKQEKLFYTWLTGEGNEIQQKNFSNLFSAMGYEIKFNNKWGTCFEIENIWYTITKVESGGWRNRHAIGFRLIPDSRRYGNRNSGFIGFSVGKPIDILKLKQKFDAMHSEEKDKIIRANNAKNFEQSVKDILSEMGLDNIFRVDEAHKYTDEKGFRLMLNLKGYSDNSFSISLKNALNPIDRARINFCFEYEKIRDLDTKGLFDLYRTTLDYYEKAEQKLREVSPVLIEKIMNII